MQQADAVCQKADDAIAKLGQPKAITDLPAYAKDAAAIVVARARRPEGAEGRPGRRGAGEGVSASALDDVVRVANGLVKVAAGGDPAAINDFVKQNRRRRRRGRRRSRSSSA